MTRTFRSPRCYDPSHSLLGRAFRRWTRDRLRGEALFLVALTGLALLLLMAHYLGWALLQSYLAEKPSRQVLFWVSQLATAGAWGGVGLLGFRPAVTATCTASTLRLEQGRRTRTIPYDAIEEASVIPATRYHRHYRRYAGTSVFIGRLADVVLLLRTERGPVVVGLPTAEAHDELKARLETSRTTFRERRVPSDA
ncbi:MAG: hypothetical protein R6T83_05440 [Salinibacter sp.]